MKENLTEVVFILDRSGSMASMAKEAIGGFNAFIEEQKKVPGELKVTLVLFDHEYTMVHSARPLAQVEPLDEKTYVPRGTTALLDAIGRTVDDVGKRLYETPERDRPSKILVAILTDGAENASHDYEKQRINNMITHQTDRYSWQFIFLAANQDAIAEGINLGIGASNSMIYDASSVVGNQTAYYALNCATTSYRCTGSVGDFSTVKISDVLTPAPNTVGVDPNAVVPDDGSQTKP